MPARRINPMSPMLGTATEQRALLTLIDSRPEIGEAITAVTGVSFDALSKQEKLIALRAYQRAGLAAAPVRQTARILRELVNEGQYVNEPLTVDQIVTQLTEELARAHKKIKKLKATLAKAQTKGTSA